MVGVCYVTRLDFMHRDVVVDAVLTERSQPGSRVAEVVLVALGSSCTVRGTAFLPAGGQLV